MRDGFFVNKLFGNKPFLSQSMCYRWRNSHFVGGYLYCNVVRSPVCQDEQVEQGTQLAAAEAPAVKQAVDRLLKGSCEQPANPPLLSILKILKHA